MSVFFGKKKMSVFFSAMMTNMCHFFLVY